MNCGQNKELKDPDRAELFKEYVISQSARFPGRGLVSLKNVRLTDDEVSVFLFCFSLCFLSVNVMLHGHLQVDYVYITRMNTEVIICV